MRKFKKWGWHILAYAVFSVIGVTLLSGCTMPKHCDDRVVEMYPDAEVESWKLEDNLIVIYRINRTQYWTCEYGVSGDARLDKLKPRKWMLPEKSEDTDTVTPEIVSECECAAGTLRVCRSALEMERLSTQTFRGLYLRANRGCMIYCTRHVGDSSDEGDYCEDVCETQED